MQLNTICSLQATAPVPYADAQKAEAEKAAAKKKPEPKKPEPKKPEPKKPEPKKPKEPEKKGKKGKKKKTTPTPPTAPTNPNLLTGLPNDPWYSLQWNLSAVNWSQARDSGLPYQTPVPVYFVDTGCTQIAGELDTSAIQYNFSDPVAPTGAQEPLFDAGYHGTATTSLICATDNGAGYSGMANFESNRCQLSMFRCEDVGVDGGNMIGIIASLSYLANAANLPPGPICLSYNTQPPNTLNSNTQIQALAQVLKTKGCVVVMPSGNWGMVDSSPEQYIRRVGGIDQTGNIASFSDTGPFPAAAPAADIYVYTPTSGTSACYITSGTSMAAPAWCAAIVDVMGVMSVANRNAVLADQIVLQTATTNPQGYKVPNIQAALQAAANY